jgi:hypothetical protein
VLLVRAAGPVTAGQAQLAFKSQSGLSRTWFSSRLTSAWLVFGIQINMSEAFIEKLEAMKADHQRHLERLAQWKANGGELKNFPEHETIDDFIKREFLAVERLSAAIDHLKANNA